MQDHLKTVDKITESVYGKDYDEVYLLHHKMFLSLISESFRKADLHNISCHTLHCVKYTRIRVLSGLHIPVFSLNTLICGPDKTRIMVYFTQEFYTKKGSFPLRNVSVNVTKSAVSCSENMVQPTFPIIPFEPND